MNGRGNPKETRTGTAIRVPDGPMANTWKKDRELYEWVFSQMEEAEKSGFNMCRLKQVALRIFEGL